MEYAVYNLVFNYDSTTGKYEEFTVGDYSFTPIDTYVEKYKSLQHLVNESHDYGDGHSTQVNTQNGIHAHTGIADNLGRGPLRPSVFFKFATSPYRENFAGLYDILLLMSLFTNRDVYCGGCITAKEHDFSSRYSGINADSRIFPFGHTLATSITDYAFKHVYDPDIGKVVRFGERINKVYMLINDPEWRNKYNDGHFLILLLGAIQQRSHASAFIQSWTIWEHLFTLLNRQWLSDKAIRNLHFKEKFSFLVTHFIPEMSVDKKAQARLEKLASVRNRLIHFGMFPDDTDIDDALFFIQLTQYICLKIVKIEPNQILQTLPKLEKFLNPIPAN